MNSKLIIILITCIIFTESAGLNRILSIIHTGEDTLRPMSARVSRGVGAHIYVRDIMAGDEVIHSKGVTVNIEDNVPNEAILNIEPEQFLQILHELVFNARVHTPPNALLNISVRADQLIIEATDYGEGIDFDKLGSVLIDMAKAGRVIDKGDGTFWVTKSKDEALGFVAEGDRLVAEEEASAFVKERKKELPYILGLSTKSEAGFGLCTVKEHVDKAGGEVTYVTGPKGTTFTVSLPLLGQQRVDGRLSERIASPFYYMGQDQLEAPSRPRPLLTLRGHLSVKGRRFALNGKLIEWNQNERGPFYTNFWQILLQLAGRKYIQNFWDSIDNDFLFDLMLPQIATRIARIDKIFYNALSSYLTPEQVVSCKAKAEESQRQIFAMFFELLSKCNIDMDIAFEYYPETGDYPNEIQIKVVNNRSLSERDRERIRDAFSIFRQTRERQKRIRLLREKGILTEHGGLGLLDFVEYIGGISSLYEFREYSGRTEQSVRIISPSLLLKEDFVRNLRDVSPNKKHPQDLPEARVRLEARFLRRKMRPIVGKVEQLLHDLDQAPEEELSEDMTALLSGILERSAELIKILDVAIQSIDKEGKIEINKNRATILSAIKFTFNHHIRNSILNIAGTARCSAETGKLEENSIQYMKDELAYIGNVIRNLCFMVEVRLSEGLDQIYVACVDDMTDFPNVMHSYVDEIRSQPASIQVLGELQAIHHAINAAA